MVVVVDGTVHGLDSSGLWANSRSHSIKFQVSVRKVMKCMVKRRMVKRLVVKGENGAS